MLDRMWSNKNSHLLLMGLQNITSTLENCLAIFYKHLHDPVIALLGIYQNQLKILVCTRVFKNRT